MFATSIQFHRCSIHVSVILSIAIAGASVHACRKAGRHIVALEDDEVIFNAILKRLIVEHQRRLSCDRTDSMRKLGFYVTSRWFCNSVTTCLSFISCT
jgi:hypothetical protein